VASRRTLESVKAADRLEEALQLATADDVLLAQNPGRPPNPIMLGLESPRYMLHILRGIRAPELEQALLVLPLDLAQKLLSYLVRLMGEGVEVELCWRVAVFLLRLYNAQVVANRALIGTLTKMRGPLRAQLEKHRDMMGFNAAGLRLLKRELEADKNSRIEDEEPLAPAPVANANAIASDGPAKKKRSKK
jgi:U3 small nucleolar RNA-associated protein 12